MRHVLPSSSTPFSPQRLEAALERSPDRDRLALDLDTIVRSELTHVLRRFPAGAAHDARTGLHDLVQDVLVLLFERDGRALRRWDPTRGRSLSSFVRLIARRHAQRVLAQACTTSKRGPGVSPTPSDRAFECDDRGHTSTQMAARLDVQRVLASLADTASDRDHTLFDLLFLEERDPAEVAQTAGMTRGAVNAWAYRLRRTLRQASNRSLPAGACRDPRANVMS